MTNRNTTHYWMNIIRDVQTERDSLQKSLAERDRRIAELQPQIIATVSSFDSDFNCFGFNLLDRQEFERLARELYLGRKVKLTVQPIVPAETVECKAIGIQDPK